MAKVWAISEGSYSDYRVLAVCTTKEVAKAIADQCSWYGVEEFTFYDEPVTPESWWKATIETGKFHHGRARCWRVKSWPWDNYGKPPLVAAEVTKAGRQNCVTFAGQDEDAVRELLEKVAADLGVPVVWNA